MVGLVYKKKLVKLLQNTFYRIKCRPGLASFQKQNITVIYKKVASQ